VQGDSLFLSSAIDPYWLDFSGYNTRGAVGLPAVNRLWHLLSLRWLFDTSHLVRTVFSLLLDATRFTFSGVRSESALRAENLFLRAFELGAGHTRASCRRAAMPRVSGHRIPQGQRAAARPILGGLHHEYSLKEAAA
jgi:hypothetical protein